jgi:phage tail-like protein
VSVPTRDANNATFYLLRYKEDFPLRDELPGEPCPAGPSTLFYDRGRNLVELLPEPLLAGDRIEPLSGLAVDVDGDIYRVDPASGRLLWRRCDGSEVDLVCEPHVLADPRGLALDRRRLLYVADPAARRVVVLDPDGAPDAVAVHAVLNGGALAEPVDVAVAPSGRVYVADRGGSGSGGEPLPGRIAIYSARFARVAQFVPRNASGLPLCPRPIAVLVDGDGTILVCDESFPRLLRFDPQGRPLADVDLPAAAAAVAGEVALDALERAYGVRPPRFLIGVCPPETRTDCPCDPVLPDEASARLAAVHAALRLLRLRLGRRYAPCGFVVSRALDSGRPGTTWHRIEVDADLPAGAALTVETFTADDPSSFHAPSADWRAPRDESGAARPLTAEVPDQLVQSPPGRYLWARVAFRSEGLATPSLRALKVVYPRVSYLDLLPRVFRRDPDGALFLEHFLGLFEKVFTGIEDRRDEFARQLDPDSAPREVIDWLACLIDLSFDPSWDLARRRALVASAMELYRTRGTVEGLLHYLRIYTGTDARIDESFLHRPARPTFLGRPGSIVGCSFGLLVPLPVLPPESELLAAYAHRFTVVVYLDDRCNRETLLPVVDRIVTVNKPAHTVHCIVTVEPGVRVGIQSSVGMDLVVGAAEVSGTRIGGCDQPGAPQPEPERTGVLGRTAVLGRRRPGYLGGPPGTLS